MANDTRARWAPLRWRDFSAIWPSTVRSHPQPRTRRSTPCWFLYREVLHQDWGELGRVERAKRPERLPVVMTRSEVDRLLIGMSGTHQLMAKLLYGTGMRH